MTSGLENWIHNGDRGVSSNTIVEILEGYPSGMLSGNRRWSTHPLDPSDFNRCYELLKAVPEYRARLSEMMAVSPVWREFVYYWDELEALLLKELPQGTAPMLFDRMQELIRGAK